MREAIKLDWLVQNAFMNRSLEPNTDPKYNLIMDKESDLKWYYKPIDRFEENRIAWFFNRKTILDIFYEVNQFRISDIDLIKQITDYWFTDES